MSKYPVWSTEELDILRENVYCTLDELEKLLPNRSKAAIMRNRSALCKREGILFKHHIRENTYPDNYIEIIETSDSIYDAARKLGGISVSTVENIKNKNNLNPVNWGHKGSLTLNLPWPENLMKDTLRNLYSYIPTDVFIRIFDETVDNILTERTKGIVKARYINGATLEEVASEYNLSRERIRQIVERAKRRLYYYCKEEFETTQFGHTDIYELHLPIKWLNALYVKGITRIIYFEMADQDTADGILNPILTNYDYSRITDAIDDYYMPKKPIVKAPQYLSKEDSIKKLHVKPRVYTACFRNNIETIGELINKTEEEIYCFYKIGKASVESIKAELAKNGFKLKEAM